MTIGDAIQILNSEFTPRGDRQAFIAYFEAREMAINTLERVQWIIDEYEHEVDLLEQDIEDDKIHRIFNSTKLAVYERVLADLKGMKEEDDDA